MSTLNFQRNGVAVAATLLTHSPDSAVFLLKDEHTDALPQVIEVKRRLPSKGGVRRLTVTRRQGVVQHAGTDNESYGIITTKFEQSIPVGIAEADLATGPADVIGYLATTSFSDLQEFGIIA